MSLLASFFRFFEGTGAATLRLLSPESVVADGSLVFFKLCRFRVEPAILTKKDNLLIFTYECIKWREKLSERWREKLSEIMNSCVVNE